MAAKADDPNKVWTLEDILKRGERSMPPTALPATRPTARAPARSRRWTAPLVVLDADKPRQMPVLLKGQNNGAMPAWKQLERHRHCRRDHLCQEQLVNKTGQLVQPAEVAGQRASKPRRQRKDQKESG